MVRRVAGALMAAASTVLCLTNGAAAHAAPGPLFPLAALLAVSPDLSGISKSALTSEAERIWRKEGVNLQWPRPRASEVPTAPLRVLVITRREAVASTGGDEWVVGELVPQPGQRALAIASIAGAERVLVKAGSRRTVLMEPQALAEYRLGIVLGRAVAHEIGHYLLDTATHAERGLMRAAIDAHEFADPSATTFALDDDAGQWLRRRLLASRGMNAPAPTAGFSYARPDITLD